VEAGPKREAPAWAGCDGGSSQTGPSRANLSEPGRTESTSPQPTKRPAAGAPAWVRGIRTPRRAAQRLRPARAARFVKSDLARLFERSERSERSELRARAASASSAEQSGQQAGPRVPP